MIVVRRLRMLLLERAGGVVENPDDLRLVPEHGFGVLHDLVLNFLKTDPDGDVDVGGGTGHCSNFFKDDMR